MSIRMNEPIKLRPATAWRTYIGGSKIRELHGNDNTADDNFPEEWIMSIVTARNSGRENIVEGISRVFESDITLSDLIAEAPIEMLGEKHYRKHGLSLGVLVKLIDSAERLTVQVHPTREKAKQLFNSEFGKTECWHIIGGREINGEKPCIYFGFKEGITREHWKECFDTQNIEEMLNCLHKFYVKPGDTFLIEGGIPHAIGAGCFLVEIQEPTDYTIRTEKVTPSGLEISDFMCHQGLGFDKMFDCFIYDGYSKEKVEKHWKICQKGNRIIGEENTSMFGLDKCLVTKKAYVPSLNTFSGIYILNGEGKLDNQDVKKGDQFYIPAACTGFEVDGNMEYIRFYGPREE